MTKLATMGTSSCATIAIQGFGTNDKYIEEVYSSSKTGLPPVLDGQTVKQFYDNVLYPTTQDLGRTCDYPFSYLMEEIDKSSMNSKFIIATLNSPQQNGGFWPELLLSFGFQLVDKTKNSIGEMCYVWVRNNNRPKDMTGVTPIEPGDWGPDSHDEDDYDEDMFDEDDYDEDMFDEDDYEGDDDDE